MTAGRRIGLDFSIDDDAFEFAASTSPADLNDQLRLIAAKLYRAALGPQPGSCARGRRWWRAMTGSICVARARCSAAGSTSSCTPSDPRWGTPPLKDVQARDPPPASRRSGHRLLASGPIEVQVFGDVTVDEAVAAVGAHARRACRRAAAPTPPAAGAISRRTIAGAADPAPRRQRHAGGGGDRLADRRRAWPTSPKAAGSKCWPRSSATGCSKSCGQGVGRQLQPERQQQLADRAERRRRDRSRWGRCRPTGPAISSSSRAKPPPTWSPIRSARTRCKRHPGPDRAGVDAQRDRQPVLDAADRGRDPRSAHLRQRRARSARDFATITPAHAAGDGAQISAARTRDWSMIVLPKDAPKPAGTADEMTMADGTACGSTRSCRIGCRSRRTACRTRSPTTYRALFGLRIPEWRLVAVLAEGDGAVAAGAGPRDADGQGDRQPRRDRAGRPRADRARTPMPPTSARARLSLTARAANCTIRSRPRRWRWRRQLFAGFGARRTGGVPRHARPGRSGGGQARPGLMRDPPPRAKREPALPRRTDDPGGGFRDRIS